MKKYIYMAVAAIAALSSCSDNDSIENATSGKEPVKQTLVFTATMEGAPQSRATYNSEHKCAAWEVNDQIIINGYLFLAQASGTSTTFSQLLEHEKRPIYVSSESNGFSNDEAPIMLVDESGTNTKWCANTSHKNGKTAWNIIVRTERPVKLHAIKLWNGGDTDEYPDRRWKIIKVLGGAQESACDNAIGTFGNLNLEANKGGFAGTIDVNATSAYEYYKIEVQEIEGGDVMQMSDMTFVYEDEKIDNAPFHAYFPATLYDGTTAVLPSQITEDWTDSKFNMPMYASSETTDLQFHNLCGVLKITVKSDEIAAVKKIKVSSVNKAVSGAFSVTSDAAVLSEPNTVANTLTVTYSDAVSTTAEYKVFYVAVPAQTYQELKIELDADGNGFTKSMTTKSATDITVERNKIYPITFAANAASATTGSAAVKGGGTVNWVQLWAGGPKFAEKNIGANSATDKGNTMTFTDATKTGDDYEWGALWCTPSRNDMEHLMTAAKGQTDDKVTCSYTQESGVWGFKFTGRETGYETNSVFFPAQYGDSSLGNAHYWSGTASGDLGCLMYLCYSNGYWSSKWYGNPQDYSNRVRPVLKN